MSKHLNDLIWPTVAFFLDFDEKITDQIWRKLQFAFAAWSIEKKKNPTQAPYLIRRRLFENSEDQKIPEYSKCPWEGDDYRVQTPLDLVNHLWNTGVLERDHPYLLARLRLH